MNDTKDKNFDVLAYESTCNIPKAYHIIPVYPKDEVNLIERMGGTIGEDMILAEETSVMGVLVRKCPEPGKEYKVLHCENNNYDIRKIKVNEHVLKDSNIIVVFEDEENYFNSIGDDEYLAETDIYSLKYNAKTGEYSLVAKTLISWVGLVIMTRLMPIEDKESVNMNVEVNHDTGVMTPIEEIPESYEIKDITLNSIMSNKNLLEAARENLSDYKGITDEDIIQVIKVVERINNKEKFSVFNALPESMQKVIRYNAVKIGATTNAEINWCARLIMEEFINNLQLEEAFIDFDKELKEAFTDVPELIDFHSESTKDFYEIKLEEHAKKLEDTMPEAAKKFREMSIVFKDTYTYTRVIDLIKENDKRIKRLDKAIESFDSICRDFNIKFKDTKYKIGDISKIPIVLDRKLEHDYSMDCFKGFAILIWYTICDLNPENPIDICYIDHVIRHILILDFIGESKTDFSEELIANIRTILDRIETILLEREQRKNVSKKSNKKS